MYIIVGLGNIGNKYVGTRHNIGFDVIDKLASAHNIKVNKSKFKGLIGEGSINGEKVLLLKPSTYMNLSGESIISAVKFYKLEDLLQKNLIVIYDDISLDVSNIRIRTKGSAGGHNGIKSIIEHLNTNEFMRIKIGVGNKPPEMDLASYVLSRFLLEEREEVIKSIENSSLAISDIIENGEVFAMNKWN